MTEKEGRESWPLSAESQAAATEVKPKQKFVVPEVSVPVDVLEATTYFQAAPAAALIRNLRSNVR